MELFKTVNIMHIGLHLNKIQYHLVNISKKKQTISIYDKRTQLKLCCSEFLMKEATIKVPGFSRISHETLVLSCHNGQF